ncbi:hypothetical protein EE612_036526 [Oryza sativa]|nr:hypothetical protein EE612_036526 [Oryza sativa]
MQRETGGLDSDTVGRLVGQVMISAPSAASDIPVPLCEKGPAERVAAINITASLKEGVTNEASDVAAAATTSGSNVPRKGRNSPPYSGPVGRRQTRRTRTRLPTSAKAKASDDRREGSAGEGGARWGRCGF